ncbi:Protein of unknown function (DUF674) [Abeliophyllum distichum]|uniref:DUF674 domain-containing protein n=1 Tax=Abeliophyllum distichum TaxID=126358 RepID=A0ABD1RB64_9LAMI
MAESKVSLKLLIDTKSKTVLFAEAGKDFVDFIFHILAMPLATAIRLLGKQGMVGCLSNLYDSLENLNDSYIQKGHNKDILLKPNAANLMTSVPLLLLNDKPTANNFYRCVHDCSNGYVTDEPTAICPSCRHLMNKNITYVAPPHVNQKSNEDGGFVKGVITYMVMDDLKVKPVSTISSITLLSEFNIKEIGALQEKEIKVGMNEALKLLKASLHSNKVLTTVFLNDI